MESEEVIVSGALSLALRFSRIVGVAPLRLEPFQNGYKAYICRYSAIYSYILITILNLVGCAAIVVNYSETLLKRHHLWSFILFVNNILVVILVSSVGSYCGISRTRTLIANFKTLKKVQINLQKDNDSKTKHLVLCAIIIIELILRYFLIVLQIHLDMKIVYGGVNVICSVFNLQSMALFALELQAILMLLEVQSTFVAMRKKLERMNYLKINETLTSRMLSIHKNVRNIKDAYITVCEVIFKVNNEYGFIFLSIIGHLVLKIISIGYYTIVFGDILLSYLYPYMIGCILNIIHCLLLIEVFNAILNEVKYMRKILSKIIYITTDVGHKIPVELDLLSQQLIFNKPQLNPMTIFNLERSLIVSIFGVIVTYTLLMLQVN